MKKIKILFLFLISHFNFSQTKTILDFETKLPIPFVTIKFGNEGIYSDELGRYKMYNTENDTIQFSCVGYKTRKTIYKNLNDTIFLYPKIEHLEEITIFSTHKILKIKAPIKNKIRWFLATKAEFFNYIHLKDDYKNSYLKEVEIPIKKFLFDNSELGNAVIRINIYKPDNQNVPGELITSSKPIKFRMNTNDKIKYKFEDIKILIEDKVCIGVELIGYIDDMGKIIEDQKSSIGLIFSSEIPKEYITMESYLKNVFSLKSYLINQKNFSKNKINTNFMVMNLTFAK